MNRRHNRAVNRIVNHIDHGKRDVFDALTYTYRFVEHLRRESGLIPVSRRRERDYIYEDAQTRLGQRATFAVLLMWATRENHYGEEAGVKPRQLDTGLVVDGLDFPKVDYDEGKLAYQSHVDLAVVTHRDSVPTGVKLGEYDTRFYRAFSLVYGGEPR